MRSRSDRTSDEGLKDGRRERECEEVTSGHRRTLERPYVGKWEVWRRVRSTRRHTDPSERKGPKDPSRVARARLVTGKGDGS